MSQESEAELELEPKPSDSQPKGTRHPRLLPLCMFTGSSSSSSQSCNQGSTCSPGNQAQKVSDNRSPLGLSEDLSPSGKS